MYLNDQTFLTLSEYSLVFWLIKKWITLPVNVYCFSRITDFLWDKFNKYSFVCFRAFVLHGFAFTKLKLNFVRFLKSLV